MSLRWIQLDPSHQIVGTKGGFTDGGPMHNSFAIIGFISSTLNNNTNFPDIQFFVNQQTEPGTDPNAVDKVRADSNFVSVYLLRPNSKRGYVKLNSNNATDGLIINPNYGTDPSDLERLAEGVKFIVDLYENTDAYREIGARLSDANFPENCKQLGYRNGNYWQCVLEFLSSGGYHFTGTCSMNAVVDSKLRVIGASGLRVADASIMPTVPNCNTNAPSIMVGERASDLILKSQWV